MFDEVAIDGQLADQRVDLAQGQRQGRAPLEVAPHEAVLGSAHVESQRGGIFDHGHAVLLHQSEHAEDVPDAKVAAGAVDTRAELADVLTGVPGARQQC